MGCTPIRTVTENLDVTLHSQVGRTTIITKQALISFMQALLYVQENQLCCEARAGSRLWCKVLKKSWDLSEVKEVTIIQEVTMVTHSHYTISIQPGLKITLLDDILYVTTPDAASLSTELVECLSGEPYQEKDLFLETENSSTYTVVYKAE